MYVAFAYQWLDIYLVTLASLAFLFCSVYYYWRLLGRPVAYSGFPTTFFSNHLNKVTLIVLHVRSAWQFIFLHSFHQLFCYWNPFKKDLESNSYLFPKWGKWAIANEFEVRFVLQSHELTIACSSRVKQVIFPNMSIDNCTILSPSVLRRENGYFHHLWRK